MMKKLPVFSYILLILLSLIVLSIGMVSTFSVKTMSDFIYSEVGTSLEEEARLIHNIIPVNETNNHLPYQEITKLIHENLKIRITFIARDGEVLSDSHEDYNIMENHGDRPEFQDAISGKIGVSNRYSTTLSQHMLYITIPPEDKNIVVRVALSVDHIRDKFFDIFSDIAVFSIIILFIAVLISIFTANSFSSIILSIKDITDFYAKGDFSKKLNNMGPTEVSQLKLSINAMGTQLKDIIDEVSFQKNELQAMLNSMEDAVILIDGKDYVLEMNPSAENLLETIIDNHNKTSVKEILKDENFIILLNETRESLSSREKTIRFSKGLDIYLQTHITPITGSEKLKNSMLIVMHDVTRIKQLENMRKDFVANVSHELKTPVTLINGFVETLMDGAMNDREKLEQFLNVINRHSRRINNIIDDLLILSNIEDKGTNINTEKVSLYDILFSAYTSALTYSFKQRTSIDIQCDDSIQIEVNPVLLEQAVLNLLNNAIKYAGEGSVIKVSAHQENNDEVIIEVADNGIGMDGEQLERIFERFYRINRQQSKKLGGTGLGLSIVKHIALAHNGRVDVLSKPGEGSTFRIFLPVQSL